MGSRQRRHHGGSIVVDLKYGGGHHPELPVEPLVVKPIDVGQGGVLDVVQPLPGPLMPDQLGLVQAVEGFSEGVDAPIDVKSSHGGRES